MIILAAAAQLQPGIPTALPAAPAPIVITQDNVELDGAGRFDFTPDPKGFNVDPPAGGTGISRTVRLWFDGTGKPIACDARQSSDMQIARTGCAQLMMSARFLPTPGMAAPFRRGFVDVKFSFFKGPPGSPLGDKMFASGQPGYTNIAIEYPPEETPFTDRIRNPEGKLVMSIEADDYPPIAIRYGLESQSAVLLGINRDGVVKTCRPISAPGLRTAFLDNYTCALFLRRAHFQFLFGATAYEGLHYLTKTMRWQIPGG